MSIEASSEFSELELLQKVAQWTRTTPDEHKISQNETRQFFKSNRLREGGRREVLSSSPQFHPKPRSTRELESRLEGQSKADLGALLDGLGVNFRGEGDQ